ncbi:MAG: PASTA domain-containing protein [Flavobacteriales bacterium]
MKQWFLFLFNKAFLRTVFLLGLVWMVLIGGVWIYLKFYTQPGATREMPALKGLTLQESREILDSEGLVAIHLDSIYSRNGRAFEVIEQVPPAGSKIKSGRRVYLTTYRSTPPFEVLGIEEGQDPGIARIILENKGFEVEEQLEPNIALVGRVVRMEDARGRILSASDRLPKGVTIRIVSGTTTQELVSIPNLRGKTLEEARRILVDAKLSLGLVEYAESVEDQSDSLKATVLEQHLKPTELKTISAGTELDLYMGLRWDRARTELNDYDDQ